ncbi:DEAD-domain-containing protein [Polyplosphaeria fusca]|uniref:RNA helicase n=1 Tax=Polyplosphaeria fusca TaxID=682080 RepID=A0A9P4V4K6_9PLEO|nr:DEAD-domain-containing protein [Polyplosphaeria fusca]
MAADAIPPPPPGPLDAPPPPPSNDVIPPPPPSNDLVPPPPPLETVPPPPPEEDGLGPALVKPQKQIKKANSRKQPPSIEDILRVKRQKAEELAKPRYLSKAERQRIALEKEQELENARRRKELMQQHRSNTLQKRRAMASGERMDIDTDSRAIPTGPRAMRQNGEMQSPRDMPPPPVPKQDEKRPGKKRSAEEAEAAEAALNRQRYMGTEQAQSTFSAKKKRRRTTEKKFNFEWNEDEDTSNDFNPIYSQQIDANFFGRGKLGGFTEHTAQKGAEKYIQALEMRDKEAGKERAAAIREMERRRREEGGRAQLDLHWSEKKLENMRERDWRIFKEDFNIATKGGNIPNPMRNWDESGLPRNILNIVDSVGYTEPSAIQRAAIPIALQWRDLIGVAVTGSGKTAAFLLPLLEYISKLPALDAHNRNDGPYAIILAPTRELAQQIEVEARKFATPLGFKTAVLVGGHSIEEQSFSLRDGAEIIIATPGRLLDCIERRVLVLSQCCYVIMDEADRMIDFGFEEPVNKILDSLPVSNEKPDDDTAEDATEMKRGIYRQTMMYTATMPAAVERIAKKYLRRPAQVNIGNVGEAVETVEQRVENVQGEEKRKKRLQEILNSGEFAAPIIVFVNIKRNCDAIARDIKHMGFNSVTLHGSKTQDQREAALASLKNGTSDVLVATDLAGRGIDVQDVSLVVNFNMAPSIEAYTHRIGRTGRAGKSGVAITFWGNEDADNLYDLKQMLSKSSLSKVPEDLRKHEAAQQKGGRKGKQGDASGFGGR